MSEYEHSGLSKDPHFDEFMFLTEAYMAMALLVQFDFEDEGDNKVVLPSVAVMPLAEGGLRLRLDPPIYGVEWIDGKTLGDVCRQFSDLVIGRNDDGTPSVETA